jgi:hypothetical protein
MEANPEPSGNRFELGPARRVSKLVHKAELVRCADHGEASCWQQFDGSHKSRHDCTCEKQPPYLCPIDAHSVRYLMNNPEWEDEAPRRHAPPPPKPKPQDCDHRGPKELVDLPGDLRAWLCKNCKAELTSRTAEVFKPDTPIELYAKRAQPQKKRRLKPMPGLQGCKYDNGKKDHPRLCGLVCDENKSMCPRHELVYAGDLARQREKEAKREERKKTAGAHRQ